MSNSTGVNLAHPKHIKLQEKLYQEKRCYVCGTNEKPCTIRISHLGIEAWICIDCINISQKKEKERLSRLLDKWE